jgi:hypothetical protein
METRQHRIEAALETLERERTCTHDERTAFERLRSRVASIEPSPETPTESPTGRGGGTAVLSGHANRSDAGVRTVRQAYRETVLLVSHFETDYGESLAENLAAELGTGLAARLFDGGRLTPQLHDTLLAACDRAIEERETYLETLATERTSLCQTRDRLDEVESRAVELGFAVGETTDSREYGEIDCALQDLKEDCETLAQRRQELLHGRSTAQLVGISGERLVQLLYDDCEATCPALADVADCLATIRTHRERCLR